MQPIHSFSLGPTRLTPVYILHQMSFHFLHMPKPLPNTALLDQPTNPLATPVLLCSSFLTSLNYSCDSAHTFSSDTPSPLHSIFSLLLPCVKFRPHTVVRVSLYPRIICNLHAFIPSNLHLNIFIPPHTFLTA